MRYGVLHDVAQLVGEGIPKPIGTAYASVIWQGDSNAQILRALVHTTMPTTVLNVGGPEQMSIRMASHVFGHRFDKEPIFEGEEA